MSKSEKENPIQLSWPGRAGDWIKKNQGDIALVAGFVLVAVISFGVGYLSSPSPVRNPLIIEGPTANISEAVAGSSSQEGNSAVTTETSQSQTQQGNDKGLIIASKNSKLYHWPWCAPAKQIKPENQIWFKSEAEAQASGRTKCADFDRLVPAGYKK